MNGFKDQNHLLNKIFQQSYTRGQRVQRYLQLREIRKANPFFIESEDIHFEDNPSGFSKRFRMMPLTTAPQVVIEKYLTLLGF